MMSCKSNLMITQRQRFPTTFPCARIKQWWVLFSSRVFSSINVKMVNWSFDVVMLLQRREFSVPKFWRVIVIAIMMKNVVIYNYLFTEQLLGWFQIWVSRWALIKCLMDFEWVYRFCKKCILEHYRAWIIEFIQ